jgi:hypothetical protein
MPDFAALNFEQRLSTIFATTTLLKLHFVAACNPFFFFLLRVMKDNLLLPDCHRPFVMNRKFFVMKKRSEYDPTEEKIDEL